VAADSKYDTLRHEIQPTSFQPYLQRSTGQMHVAVRTSVPPGSIRGEIQRAIEDVDRALPVTDFKTQTDQINETIGKERVFTRLLTLFGAFALLLACIGLHGVTSYSVARRTSEIGIRLALGARRSQVLWLVLRQVIVLALAGLALGLPAAWLGGPLVRGLLFGLAPTDAGTIAGAGAIMFIAAVVAGWLPARRAAWMEALTALRTE
jgi:ABC-type antimicrobial peptide transport system permease subunit